MTSPPGPDRGEVPGRWVSPAGNFPPRDLRFVSAAASARSSSTRGSEINAESPRENSRGRRPRERRDAAPSFRAAARAARRPSPLSRPGVLPSRGDSRREKAARNERGPSPFPRSDVPGAAPRGEPAAGPTASPAGGRIVWRGRGDGRTPMRKCVDSIFAE